MDDFEKALNEERVHAKDDSTWKSVMFKSNEAKEAERNINESMRDILTDWNEFISDPTTIDAMKALPEWKKDEEEAFLQQSQWMRGVNSSQLTAVNDVLRTMGETDKSPEPTKEDEVIRKNLLLCIKKEAVTPMFARHLEKSNRWTIEVAEARASEFLTELEKTLD